MPHFAGRVWFGSQFRRRKLVFKSPETPARTPQTCRLWSRSNVCEAESPTLSEQTLFKAFSLPAIKPRLEAQHQPDIGLYTPNIHRKNRRKNRSCFSSNFDVSSRPRVNHKEFKTLGEVRGNPEDIRVSKTCSQSVSKIE